MKLKDVSSAVLIWGAVSEESLINIKQAAGVVVVPENRPYLTGLKHNIILLKQAGVNCVYVSDNMLGLLFYKGKIAKTFLYYKEINKDSVVGVCGSLYVCLLAKLHSVPIEIFPQADYLYADPYSCKPDGLEKTDFSDTDVSTLAGRDFFAPLVVDKTGRLLEEQRQKYIVVSKDEEIIR